MMLAFCPYLDTEAGTATIKLPQSTVMPTVSLQLDTTPEATTRQISENAFSNTGAGSVAILTVTLPPPDTASILPVDT
jgi:hypothetical protein